MATGSSGAQQRAVEDGRRAIARGERPRYHAVLTASPEGAADVRIRELPLVHVFAPADGRAVDAARLLIARLLDVDPASFDVDIDGYARG